MNALLKLNTILFVSMILSACASTNPKIIKIETPEMPLIRAAMYFPFGGGTEKSGEEGATFLVSRWMDFGTEKKTMDEFNQVSLGLGAAIGTNIEPRFTMVTVEAPAAKFAKAWELALEKVRNPKLATADLETVRSGMISAKQNRLTSWSVAGRQLGSAVIYAGTPDANPGFGTNESLKNLSAEQLKEFYIKTFGKGPALVLVSKNLSSANEEIINKSIVNWGSSFKKAELKPFMRKGKHILFIDRPGSSQAYLFFVKPGPPPGSDDQALASIGSQLLGSNGGNSSILFDELRAKRGLTYHASFQIAKKPHQQAIFGVTFGANEKVGELASLYLAEWKKFYDRTDIPEADLKEANIAYRAMRDRDNGETIGELIQNAAESMSVSGDTKPTWRNPAVTQTAFNAAKAKWLVPDNFTLLVLGDPSKVQTALENAIGPVTETKVLPPTADWDDVNNAIVGH